MTRTKHITQRAYAIHRGVSGEAVSRAIAEGRLRESVVIIGTSPKIADVELADREWEANTRPRIDEPRQPSRADIPDYYESRALREAASARRETAQATIAELDLAERRGDLIPVAAARADVIDKFTMVKTRILGVPTRIAQRMPHVAAEVVPVLDELLREALDELSIDEEDVQRFDVAVGDSDDEESSE